MRYESAVSEATGKMYFVERPSALLTIQDRVFLAASQMTVGSIKNALSAWNS